MNPPLPESALTALETRASLVLRDLPALCGGTVPWADQHDAAAVLRLIEEVRHLRSLGVTAQLLFSRLREIDSTVHDLRRHLEILAKEQP